jgi:hypothetical protein
MTSPNRHTKTYYRKQIVVDKLILSHLVKKFPYFIKTVGYLTKADRSILSQINPVHHLKLLLLLLLLLQQYHCLLTFQDSKH